MKPYRDLNNDSGINAYKISDDSIAIRFKTGSVYLYNYSTTGAIHVEEMKKLAEFGDGLNSYINTRVRNSYAKQLL